MGWDSESEYRPAGDLMPLTWNRFSTAMTGCGSSVAIWLDAFEDLRWEPEEILDFGDAFLGTAQQSGHRSGSGVTVAEPVFQLFKLRGGLG